MSSPTAFALMATAAHRMLEYDPRVRQEKWGSLFHATLHRATVGIIGFGRIGRAFARRCKGFSMDVLVWDPAMEADAIYEQGVFRAKVYAAIRKAEGEADFLQFQAYRMRVFDAMAGKQVAEQLGVSEPTVSRHLQRVRDLLRRRLGETVATYSFTEDEQLFIERSLDVGRVAADGHERACDTHLQRNLVAHDFRRLRAHRKSDHFAAVFFLQAQRLFQREAVRLVGLEADVGLANPRRVLLDAQRRVLRRHLLDADDTFH